MKVQPYFTMAIIYILFKKNTITFIASTVFITFSRKIILSVYKKVKFPHLTTNAYSMNLKLFAYTFYSNK